MSLIFSNRHFPFDKLCCTVDNNSKFCFKLCVLHTIEKHKEPIMNPIHCSQPWGGASKTSLKYLNHAMGLDILQFYNNC